TVAPNVIVVPFFISDGLHSYEDIPALLGIEDDSAGAFPKNPHHLRARRLYYAHAIGTERRFADAIVEQALNAGSVAHAGQSARETSPQSLAPRASQTSP